MLNFELVEKVSVSLNSFYVFKINGGRLMTKGVASLKAKELFNTLFLDIEAIYIVLEKVYSLKGIEADVYIINMITSSKEIDSFSRIYCEEYKNFKSERNIPKII